jgi:hypothetical protein
MALGGSDSDILYQESGAHDVAMNISDAISQLCARFHEAIATNHIEVWQEHNSNLAMKARILRWISLPLIS